MTNYPGICLVIFIIKTVKDIKINFLLIIIHDIYFSFLDPALGYYEIKINETSLERQKKETNIVARRRIKM